MQFRSEDYFRAAIERWKEARILHDAGDHYALSMYCSGLAVECMPRAFRWNKQESFDGRHDLKELLKASDLLRTNDHRVNRNDSRDVVPDYSQDLRAAINEVAALWHNNLRFASEDRH